jgi:formiminoglutamase
MSYNPPVKNIWSGRDDGSQALRNHQVIKCIPIQQLPNHFHENSFALLGFVCDEGVKRNSGRVGAAEGPRSFREAFANLPANHTHSLYDCGDIVCKDHNLEEAQKELAHTVSALLRLGITPIVIGGGHELAWGQFQGYTTAHPNHSCAIVNYDAHYDIRPLVDEKGNSGTPFRQIYDYCTSHNLPFDYTCVGISKFGNTQYLHDEAKKMKIKTLFAEDIHMGSAFTKDPKQDVFLSICLDVFDAAHAPGVSAPQPLGLTPWQLLPSMFNLMHSGKVAMIGVAELNPIYDRDNSTAKLAAQIVNSLLSQRPY